MFNALNRFISRLDGDLPQNQQQDPNDGTFGFQVLRNTNSELAIEPWFDFVVGINGRAIDNPDPRLFVQEVLNCASATVSLGVWSAKGQRVRTLHIPVPAADSLGLSLQWTPLSVVSNIWHVLDVPANSPTDLANIFPFSDWILGTPEGTLHGEGGLGELVEDHLGRPLRLWVYNNEYNVTREVTITPSRDWGGEGAMGCVLGYGALHRLPAPLSEPVQGPGETLFTSDDGKSGYGVGGAGAGTGAAANMFVPTPTSGTPLNAGGILPPPPPPPPEAEGGAEYLVPAQMVSTPGTTPPPRGYGKQRKKHHVHAGPDMMDDYFKEEEQKSKELDNAPVSSKSKGLPPPPKAGGPPKAPQKAVAKEVEEEDEGPD
ncbi:hypothetical protein MKZ38_003635 [Zalerion maritima]|uniref:PDZ GRASP-type domain-containing protein n=1 Tax=Zalerion maritima TaxID=339359 RepID=A0AAD5WRL8_9PEZI|nr:hypothetical protein MKZ38_003635 [Zalerion maritima]